MNIKGFKVPAIRSLIESHVWAIDPVKLEAMLEVVSLRAEGGSFTAEEIVARIGDKAARPMGRVQGAVAVLPLYGVIAPKMNLMSEISGGTSAEMFGKEFQAAIDNPDVGAVVLDVSSPGGDVQGTPELAARVFAARGTKPIVAVANGQMCSAAYWIASAADQIVATPSAVDIGNIGVYTVHRDMSAANEKEGVKYTIIGAGKYKAEGNPHAAPSEEFLEFTGAKVSEFYGMFVGAVAKHLGVKASEVRSGYGEGRALTAKQALEAGLVHRIATLDDVIAGLAGSKKSGSKARAEDAPTVLHIEHAGSPDQLAAAVAESLTGISASMGASPTPQAHTPTPALKARMVSVENGNTAANGAAPDNALSVEQKRVKDIGDLCLEHKIDAGQTMTYVNSRMDVGQVARDILSSKRDTTSTTRTAVQVGGVTLRAEKDARKGFASHVEFLAAVIDAAGIQDPSNVPDERLRPLAQTEKNNPLAFLMPRGFRATVSSDEQGNYADQYGGYFSPTQVMPGLLSRGFEGDPTAGMTQKIPMSAPTVKLNARTDSNHTTSVSGGFTVTRTPETVAATSSRASFEQVTLEATALTGLAFASEQLLADSPVSFAAIIDAGFRDQFGAHKLNEKIRGGGGAAYLGVLDSPALVTVNKESGQAADTIVTANLLKMRARCWGYGNAVWLANHDTMPQFGTLSVGIGAAGVLTWQKDIVADKPDVLLGRPLIFTEYASKLGDLGDVMLVNFSQYLEGIYQPLQSAESIHVRFVNSERTFKLWERNAGAPWWRAALTPAKSSDTLSPMVTLQAR